MRRQLTLLVCLLTAIYSPVARGAVSVVNLPCGVRIQADAFPGATTYVFRRSVVNYCGEFFIVAMWVDALGSASVPSMELGSTPAFSGTYQVDAVGPAGEVLSTQSSQMLVNEPARGRFYHPGSASTLEAMPGELLTIRLGYAVPATSTVEWLRDGEVVQSGTAPDLQWQIQPSDHGAVFTSRVSNDCGLSEGPGQLMQVQQPPPGSLARWSGARTVDTLQVPGYYVVFGSCIGCWVPIVTRTELSEPNAPCIVIDGDAFSTSCGVSVSAYRTQSFVTRLQFFADEAVVLSIAGFNQVPVNPYTGLCGSVSGSLSGPVSATSQTALEPGGHLSSNSRRAPTRSELLPQAACTARLLDRC
jgi:hypothetical protein